MRLALLSLLVGCGPGHLASEAGGERLVTALFTADPDGATVLLSNGAFECDLPRESDPADQQLAYVELLTAACREDARHVLLRLFRRADSPWEGDWQGLDGANATWLSADRPRMFSARYFSVQEAEIREQFGILRTYRPVEVIDEPVLGDGASLELRGLVLGEGEVPVRLAGAFSVPEIDVSGRFDALPCDGEAELFGLLASNLGGTCP